MIDYKKFKKSSIYILIFLIFFLKSSINFLKHFTESFLGISTIEGVFDLKIIKIKKKLLPSTILTIVILILVKFINIDKFLQKLYINKFTGLKTDSTELTENFNPAKTLKNIWQHFF